MEYQHKGGLGREQMVGIAAGVIIAAAVVAALTAGLPMENLQLFD